MFSFVFRSFFLLFFLLSSSPGREDPRGESEVALGISALPSESEVAMVATDQPAVDRSIESTKLVFCNNLVSVC